MDWVKLDLNGFSVRKSQVERNFVKELIQAQYFIVHFVQNCNISSPFQFSIEYLTFHFLHFFEQQPAIFKEVFPFFISLLFFL